MVTMPGPHVLTVDFGTSGIKCMVFSSTGDPLARRFTPVSYHDAPGLTGIGKEFDAAAAWTTMAKMIRSCLRDAKAGARDVVGIAATSQRHGAVFLDAQGGVVYAGPNLDARGVMVQDSIMEPLQNACPPTGCWPPLLYPLCRLLWFKSEKPELYSRIRHVLSISDWIAYQLTGEATTDPSQASNTQFMDVRKGEWSPEILKTAGIASQVLPPIREPGALAGTVTAAAAKATGLRAGTRVGIGGADTQCGLLGSGAVMPGDVCVVAGNTAPIQMVTAEPIIDSECRLWTGRHMLPRQWVLEANTGTTGSVLSWFAKNIIAPADERIKTDDEAYARVEHLASKAEAGALDAMALLGPQVMNASELATVRPSMFLFPPPASPVVKPIALKEMARALYENICYAVRANLELLQTVSSSTFKRCLVAGGVSRSQFWRQMLADVTGLEIHAGHLVEASSLGAAICAAKVANLWKSLPEAVRHMVKSRPVQRPQEDVRNTYETYFSRWKALYQQSANL
jgi:sugar (pentulose or hexulose) kinase